MIEDVNSFCENVELFSQNKLLEKEDLQTLLAAAVSSANEELFFSIAFTAKYIQGLIRVIQQASTNPEINNLQQIKDDLTENMKKIRTDLKRLIANESKEVQQHFEEKYFLLTGESFMNLRDLLSDLEWVKIYDNQLLRTK